MSHDFARSQRLRKESANRQPVRKKSSGVPSWLWLLVGTLVGCLIMFLVYLSGVRPPVPSPAATTSAPPVSPAETSATSTPPAPADQPPAPPKRVSPVFEFYTKLPEGGPPATEIAPGAQPAATAVPSPVTTESPPVSPAPSPAMATAPAPAPAQEAAPQDADEEPMDPIQQLLAQKEKEKQQGAAGRPAETKPKTDAAAGKAPVATKPAANGGRYLQAGVFRNRAEAEKLRSKMSRLGVSASIQTVNSANGEALQKVLAGPFSSAQGMDDARIILGGNGVNTIPVK